MAFIPDDQTGFVEDQAKPKKNPFMQALETAIPPLQLLDKESPGYKVGNILSSGAVSGAHEINRRLTEEPAPKTPLEAIDPKRFYHQMIEPEVLPALGTAFTYVVAPKIISKAFEFLKSPSKLNPFRILGDRMTTLAEKANQTGHVVGDTELMNDIRAGVQKISKIDPRMANPEVQAALRDIEVYVKTGSPGYKTPTELLELRKYFADSLPKNWFQALVQKGKEKEVYDAARYVVSQAAKGTTPGLAKIDTIYNALAKVLGTNWVDTLTRGAVVSGIGGVRKLLGGGGNYSQGATTYP